MSGKYQLGKRVRYLLDEIYMINQKDLAEKMNVPTTTTNRFCGIKSENVRIEFLLDFIHTLPDVDLNYLLRAEDIPKPTKDSITTGLSKEQEKLLLEMIKEIKILIRKEKITNENIYSILNTLKMH